MNVLVFTVGLVIFVTYMIFLVRMINTQHKKQEKEQGSIKEAVGLYKVKQKEWKVFKKGKIIKDKQRHG